MARQTGQLHDVSEKHVRLPNGHRLWLRTAGPTREASKTPLVVLIHGLGGSAREWSAVQDIVARFARVALYERGGYHGSDACTSPPTLEAIARDLRALLDTAGLEPPYLLVGHSYGGVIASRFLQDCPATVGGMVLIDSPPVVRRVPPGWTSLLGDDATYEQVVGLEENVGIGPDAYKAILRESALNEQPGGIAEKELELMAPANAHLRDNLLFQGAILGMRPLNVVFCNESNDFRKVYEYGVKQGHGSSDEREVLRKHLETMSTLDEAAQREQLGLSSNARFMKADGIRATHNAHVVDPGWTAEQIRWAFDQAVSGQ